VKDGRGPVRARRGSSGGPWWTETREAQGVDCPNMNMKSHSVKPIPGTLNVGSSEFP